MGIICTASNYEKILLLAISTLLGPSTATAGTGTLRIVTSLFLIHSTDWNVLIAYLHKNCHKVPVKMNSVDHQITRTHAKKSHRNSVITFFPFLVPFGPSPFVAPGLRPHKKKNLSVMRVKCKLTQTDHTHNGPVSRFFCGDHTLIHRHNTETDSAIHHINILSCTFRDLDQAC